MSNITDILDKWLDADERISIAGGLMKAADAEVARSVEVLRELRKRIVERTPANSVTQETDELRDRIMLAVTTLALAEAAKANATQEEARAIADEKHCTEQLVGARPNHPYGMEQYIVYRNRVWTLHGSRARLFPAETRLAV